MAEIYISYTKKFVDLHGEQHPRMIFGGGQWVEFYDVSNNCIPSTESQFGPIDTFKIDPTQHDGPLMVKYRSFHASLSIELSEINADVLACQMLEGSNANVIRFVDDHPTCQAAIKDTKDGGCPKLVGISMQDLKQKFSDWTKTVSKSLTKMKSLDIHYSSKPSAMSPEVYETVKRMEFRRAIENCFPAVVSQYDLSCRTDLGLWDSTKEQFPYARCVSSVGRDVICLGANECCRQSVAEYRVCEIPAGLGFCGVLETVRKCRDEDDMHCQMRDLGLGVVKPSPTVLPAITAVVVVVLPSAEAAAAVKGLFTANYDGSPDPLYALVTPLNGAGGTAFTVSFSVPNPFNWVVFSFSPLPTGSDTRFSPAAGSDYYLYTPQDIVATESSSQLTIKIPNVYYVAQKLIEISSREEATFISANGLASVASDGDTVWVNQV